MVRNELTKRQEEIYSYLVNYINKNPYPPTMREIGEAFSISIKGISDHIQALEKKGYLRHTPRLARSIELVDQVSKEENSDELIQLPILGSVAAGLPLFSEENFDGNLSISSSMLSKKGEYFALRVVGDSMIDVGIMSEDFAIILKQNQVSNGTIVVARTSEGSVTLKRFFKEGNRFKLVAENSNYSPIYSSEVQILGKLCMIVRNY